MLRDITIGQFYPVSSPIHALDPRFKILAAFVYLISLFLVDSLWAFLPVLVFVALLVKLSKVPFSYIVKGLRPILFIVLFAFAINMFFTPGRILFEWRFLTITYEGVHRAVLMASRLVFLIVGTSLLTLTTSPIELTDGIEYLLKPLEVIRVPAHEIAMMMTIALRFIPTLLEETDKIMKAQMARGADFESGNMARRAKNLIPLLVPLFISAFRRADELAMAMEARCYQGGHNRTRMKVLAYGKKDALGGLVLALHLALMITLRVVL